MISPFLYESIYRKYRPIVFSYISQRVASREDAEDLCQDVFVKLSRALETYDEDKAAYEKAKANYLPPHSAGMITC